MGQGVCVRACMYVFTCVCVYVYCVYLSLEVRPAEMQAKAHVFYVRRLVATDLNAANRRCLVYVYMHTTHVCMYVCFHVGNVHLGELEAQACRNRSPCCR
jgi:hypothetical protein